MRKITPQKLILLFIIVFAAVLRLYHLDGVPPSASMDESSISYNAYSIIQTGKDEYGELPGFSHRSYDDWRRATYLYIALPFIWIFDLHVIAIRLPAVLLSLLTIFALYHIVCNLFSKKNYFGIYVGLISSFLLAISPWHIYLSRLGHESNAYMSFFVFGIALLIYGISVKKISVVTISYICFLFSLISYYAGQVIVPLFLLLCVFVFYKELVALFNRNVRTRILFISFFFLIGFILFELFSPQSLIRFQGTSTFSPDAHRDLYTARMELWKEADKNGNLIGKVLYGKYTYPIQVFFEGYFSHFSFSWLFFNSSGEPHKVPHMGLLYVWQLPFIILGIVMVIKTNRMSNSHKLILLFWLFASPLPGAIATQAPHAMRSYTLVGILQIFSAIGIIYFFRHIKQKNIIFLGLFFLLCVSIYYFYINYFIVFPKEQSKSFHYAFSKMVPFVLSIEKKYNRIVFDTTDNLYQSYMVFLYHSKFSPKEYQKYGGTRSGGFAETHRFGKYEFRPIDLNSEKMEKNTLYVINGDTNSDSLQLLNSFTNFNGEIAIKVVSL